MNRCTVDLAAVKVGDRVAWIVSTRGPWGSESAIVATVERLTPTQIVVRSTGRAIEYRFRRSNGTLVGDVWTYLLNATDERVVRAQVVARTRRAFNDADDLGRQVKITDGISAVAALGRLREIVETALQDITQEEK